jgi:hypothetical protein
MSRIRGLEQDLERGHVDAGGVRQGFQRHELGHGIGPPEFGADLLELQADEALDEAVASTFTALASIAMMLKSIFIA